MQVSRIGFTPVKGTRHAAHPSVSLTSDGPAGDRLLCLVDPVRRRVLRTVENPSLVRAVSRWEPATDAAGPRGTAGTLTVEVAGEQLTGRPVSTGRHLAVDYWGRRAEVEVVRGPWARAFSELLGCEVVLARVERPGGVVYGGSVTVVTTGALAELGRRLGANPDSARFRATLLVDTGADDVEESWVGRRLRVGAAVLAVRGLVPRCAVVDVGPATGERDEPVLSTLAGYRREQQQVHFGVDAVVVRPGSVSVGDSAEVERG